MNLKQLLLSAVAAFGALTAGALTSVPYEFDCLPEGSGFELVSVDDATSTIRLHVFQNDGGGLAPWIRFKPIDKAVPAEAKAMSFDYRTTAPCSNMQLIAYKTFMGSAIQYIKVDGALEVSDQWRSMRIYIGSRRGGNIRMLDKPGQYQELKFYDLPVGADIELRNFRYEEDEQPFRHIEISATESTVVEAEDFNTSASGLTGCRIRHEQIGDQPVYKNPTGNEYPIFAWGSVDYENSLGPEGLVTQYKELAECGFNLTLGTAWPGVDQSCLFDGRNVNGTYVDPFKDLNLKMIVKAGTDDPNWADLVRSYSKSPRLAGYFIKDEPFYDDFPYMTNKVARIRSVDDEHLFYGNLLTSEVMRTYKMGAFEDYVQKYVRDVRTGFLSFDFYPVRQEIATGEIKLMPHYLETLEIIAKLGKLYNQPFWAFAHSVESKCGVEIYRYPTPTEEHLRLQVFTNMAYGAQGLQYFTYKCPWDASYGYTNAPIDLDNQKTPTWYMVQNINREVLALSPVFLGAEMLRVGQTNPETPIGCVRLTPSMLPAGVADVTSDGTGVCVSVLQNESRLYLMVVNTDVKDAQNVSVVLSKDIKRVLADCSEEAVAAGSHSYQLGVGGYLLLLVNENEPMLQHYTPGPLPADSGYRYDMAGVNVTATEAASNGHFVPNMGNSYWGVYSAIRQEYDQHIISREDAVANWGATFDYYVDVPEEMDVDIYVGHFVPETEYTNVKATGVEPGYGYVIRDEESLNWPKEYAASMTMTLDGTPLQVNGADSDVLSFLPAGGDEVNFRYNSKPDYAKVTLTPGSHKIGVTSLCYPWHFDNILIKPHEDASVKGVEADSKALSVVGLAGSLIVRTEGSFTVYTASGCVVARGENEAEIALRPGLYIVASENGRTLKAIVK